MHVEHISKLMSLVSIFPGEGQRALGKVAWSDKEGATIIPSSFCLLQGTEGESGMCLYITGLGTAERM